MAIHALTSQYLLLNPSTKMKLSIPQTLSIAALLLASGVHSETITLKVKLMVAVGIPAGARVYPLCEIVGNGYDAVKIEHGLTSLTSKNVPYADALVPKLLPKVPGSSNFIGSTDVVFAVDVSSVQQKYPTLKDFEWQSYICKIAQVTANGAVTELSEGPNAVVMGPLP